jgi:outer membrane protein TolC
MDNLEKSLNDSRAMYEQGMVEQTDVDQIQIQLSSLQNTINSTRRQLEQLQNMMKIQLGVELDKPVLLTQDLQDIIRNTQLDGSVDREFRVQENVSYQLMDTQVKLSELDLKRQKSQFLPSLSAFYNFRENAMRNKFNPLDGDKKWYESSTLGFQLSVPVFSSGQRISRVQQAKLNLQKTRNNLSETRKNLQNRFIQTKNNYHTAYDNYQTSRDNMNLARRVYERISKKYSEGMAGSMELTQANRDYLNAQSEYIRSLVELLNARTELDKILNEL